MTPDQQFTVAMVTVAAAMLATLGTLVVSVLNFLAGTRNAKKLAEIHTQGEVQHEMLNSGLAKLEDATKKIAYAAGMVEGRRAATAEGEAKASGLAEGLALPQSPALPQPEKP